MHYYLGIQNMIYLESFENSTKRYLSHMMNQKIKIRKNIGHSSVQKKKPASIYPQLPGGKYEIIGTLATLRLKSGETLRNLALKYYGSKNYVPYIVIYNKIENPDIIAENTEIKIPELRRKEE